MFLLSLIKEKMSSLWGIVIKDYLHYYLAAFFLIMFLSVCGLYVFESPTNQNLKTVWDCIWWFMVTVTTIGYGDKFPVTFGGQVVAILTMISVLGIVATLLSQISLLLIRLKQNIRKGEVSVNFADHVVVIGFIPGKTIKMIKNFLIAETDCKLVLVSDALEEHSLPEEKNVAFVKVQKLFSEDMVKRTNLAQAKSVVIYEEDSAKTIAAAIIVCKHVKQGVSVSIYAPDDDAGYVVNLLDEIAKDIDLLVFADIMPLMMSQAITDPHAPEAVELMLNNEGDDDINTIVSRGSYQFGDLFFALKNQYNITIQGIKKQEQRTVLNPPVDYVVKKGDILQVIAESQGVCDSIDWEML